MKILTYAASAMLMFLTSAHAQDQQSNNNSESMTFDEVMEEALLCKEKPKHVVPMNVKFTPKYLPESGVAGFMIHWDSGRLTPCNFTVRQSTNTEPPVVICKVFKCR